MLTKNRDESNPNNWQRLLLFNMTTCRPSENPIAPQFPCPIGVHVTSIMAKLAELCGMICDNRPDEQTIVQSPNRRIHHPVENLLSTVRYRILKLSPDQIRVRAFLYLMWILKLKPRMNPSPKKKLAPRVPGLGIYHWISASRASPSDNLSYSHKVAPFFTWGGLHLRAWFEGHNRTG